MEHLFYSVIPAVITLGIAWCKRSEIFGDDPFGAMVEAIWQHRPNSVVVGLPCPS